MKIGDKVFDFKNKSYIMGILNVTPDSFSDGGKFNNVDRALEQVTKMVEEGVDIIDIGGESTRPNYTPVSDEDEIRRIIPVITELKKSFTIPISVDTHKSHVAKAALDAGADLINDIWGLKHDKDMAKLIGEYQVPVCIMHNRKDGNYKEFISDIVSDLKESINIAKSARIKEEQIIIDPGIGFAKSYQENLFLLKNLEVLHELGFPILLGSSRKSVIGNALNERVENRLEGTIATSVFGRLKGCSIFRVHDVLENRRAIQMTETIMNSTLS